LFYTRFPVPGWIKPSFEGIAALAPLVGLLLGGLLLLVDAGLQSLELPPLLRSGLIVALWIGLTGGLHVDGAMDTADGLAVMDPQKRLEAMADSRTGAFGTIAAIAILGFKTIALAELASGRALVLLAAPLWGRWGQVIAIGRYPYLKSEGKGALHKASFQSPGDILPGFIGALVLYGLYGWLQPELTGFTWKMFPAPMAFAVITAAWFNHRLGGHTGDTYGAVVEWTEVLVLMAAVLLQR
jgi:adenosylcobinamide-GDP ribazoletransferase